MLALHGFDVFGLEVSETGASVAREYAQSELHSPQDYNFGSQFKESPGVRKGEVTILQGDFFKRDWESVMQFDLIYDYTVRFTLLSTLLVLDWLTPWLVVSE